MNNKYVLQLKVLHYFYKHSALKNIIFVLVSCITIESAYQ